jgi:hypothetical protein
MKNETPEKTRKCSRCNAHHPKEAFTSRAWYYGGYCRDCRKAYDADRSKRLWAEYKASPEYEAIEAERKGRSEKWATDKFYREQQNAYDRSMRRLNAESKAYVKDYIARRKLGEKAVQATMRKVVARIRRNVKKAAYSLGLDTQEVWESFVAHGKRCDICGADGHKQAWGRLMLDHCHTTGKFRGWLCVNCNSGIGMFRDDPDIMRAAIKYVSNPK